MKKTYFFLYRKDTNDEYILTLRKDKVLNSRYIHHIEVAKANEGYINEEFRIVFTEKQCHRIKRYFSEPDSWVLVDCYDYKHSGYNMKPLVQSLKRTFRSYYNENNIDLKKFRNNWIEDYNLNDSYEYLVGTDKYHIDMRLYKTLDDKIRFTYQFYKNDKCEFRVAETYKHNQYPTCKQLSKVIVTDCLNKVFPALTRTNKIDQIIN